MAEKQEDKELPKYLNPAWFKTKILNYKEKYGQKILVFLFFVFISAVIWFFSALGKNYVTYVKFPVRYNNFPPDKVLVNELPEQLSIKIRSVGSTILSYKLSSGIRPVTFNVNSFLKEKFENSTEFYVLTSTAQSAIQNQFASNIQVYEIKPDTIFFQLADMVSKTVKVNPNLDISFQQQYMQKGKIILTPDSITISGPQVIVDTINEVTTKRVQYKNINDTIKKELELVSIPGITFSVNEIGLTINSEKFTESEIIVPIKVKNLPDSLEMKIFPKTATIKYNVGLSDFGYIYPEQFTVSLNYEDAIQNLNRKVNISLDEYPEHINNVTFYPKTIEFIIEK